MSDASGTCEGAVRVLIVDDEPELTELLSAAVTEAGWRSFTAENGRSALSIARDCAPDVMILDGMLPDVDGVHVLRRLRSENMRLPVLMLTARDALEHRLDGLSSGADGYVTEPFSLEEVMVRQRGLLRRASPGDTSDRGPVLVPGHLVLAETTRKVSCGGTAITLTTTKFDLLQFLMSHPHQVLSKARILNHVWNASFDGEGNLVEVYIYGA